MQLVKNQFFASCPVGLEELLVEEIKELGINGAVIARGGVHFQSNLEQSIKVMIWSRIASRIFRKILLFNIHSEEDFYYKLENIRWTDHIKKDQTFSFKAIFTHNKRRKTFLKNSRFAALKAKDSLCDFFMNKFKERPSVDTKTPDCAFLFHIKATQKVDKVTMLIDMTGEPLSHRGYRTSGFQAPLRENLAAALIKFGKWNKQDFFIDGMTGSGTFLIEAALIKANLPPSFLKLEDDRYNIWSFQNHDRTRMSNQEILDLAQYEEGPIDNSFLGVDIDARSIRQTRVHLNQLKFCDIELKTNDFLKEDFPIKENVFIILNPPYGERMGEKEELEELYFQIGEKFKQNFKNSTLGIISSDKKLLHKIRLKPHLKKEVRNGDLQSFFYCYETR